MNVECRICGIKDKGTRDQLIDKGWEGVSFNINSVKGKAEFCHKHSSPENVVAYIKEVKRASGVRVFDFKEMEKVKIE